MNTVPRRPLQSLLRFLAVAVLFTTSGCEIGRSWFSMSSDSPTPWMGIDLLPRRKTTQLMPQERDIRSGSSKVSAQPVVDRSRLVQQLSKELHLPAIPVFFDDSPTEELSFNGPEGAFTR